MKMLRRLLIGLCLIACAALSRAELAPVAFVIGQQQFKPGDTIVIDQVLATAPNFEVGTKIVVRGHYHLASAAKASLGLFLTHRSQADADPFAPSQIAPIEKASGAFEVACEIKYAGDPHVSFYPATGGESFGGVYFSAAPRKS